MVKLKIKKGYLICTIIFLAVAVINFNYISSVKAQPNNNFPTIDPRIEEELINKDEVRVIITLKANLISNYSPSTRNSDEYNLWVEDIKKQVNEIQSKVIPSLSEDEFKIRHIFELSPSFSGSITKRGLDKLINDSNIERIELVERTYSSLSLRISNEEEITTCINVSDCIIVSLTCCGCEIASINIPIKELLISINKNYVDKWETILNENCQNTICASGVNPDQAERCNTYFSKCVNNRCIISNNNESLGNNNESLGNRKNKIEIKNFYLGLLAIFLLIIIILILYYIKKEKNDKK